jgi:hypothetical protein
MSIRLSATLIILACLGASARSDEAGFESLFNGDDLDGWVRVNTAPSTWTVKDGLLICSGKPIGELRTTRMYQNFVMEVEWRHMKPKGNAGIFVWADDITARGVPFHRSIEVQVLENAYGNSRGHTTHGDIFPIHGAKMMPINGRGGSRAFPTEERSKPSPEWNHYRIECSQGQISLAVNGKVVTRGKECSPRKGYICLESEGGIVHYRNLKIKELPDTPVKDEHVAIADRGYRSIYSGVDLSGWKTAAKDKWKVNDWVLSYAPRLDSADPALVTEELYGDFGFVFDVRRKAQSGTAAVQLRGPNGIRIELNPDNPVFAEKFSSNGWNRFEGTLKKNRLELSLNGTSVIKRDYDNVPERGSLRLLPEGPIDFANLFIRDLP